MLDAERCRGIALGVQIDEQHGQAAERQRCGQVDRAGGLADAALLVGHHEDAGRARSRKADCLRCFTGNGGRFGPGRWRSRLVLIETRPAGTVGSREQFHRDLRADQICCVFDRYLLSRGVRGGRTHSAGPARPIDCFPWNIRPTDTRIRPNLARPAQTRSDTVVRHRSRCHRLRSPPCIRADRHTLSTPDDGARMPSR